MSSTDILFWNVDTQIDFVHPSGKLYVPDAELLKPTWKKITNFAKQHDIKVISTCDYHNSNSKELSSSPNFVTTFPEHCMANTLGADFVAETMPENPLVIDWDKKYSLSEEILNVRNIVIRKDAFDVFKGNQYTESVLKIISPKKVVVYGVTTNVCVNDAVVGLAERVEKVYVISDAIKELPNIPLPFDNWEKLGVMMIQTKELARFIDK